MACRTSPEMAEMYHELSAVLLRLTLPTARQFCPVGMAAPIDLGERVGFDIQPIAYGN